MLAKSRVSSWCVPFSISWLARSSGVWEEETSSVGVGLLRDLEGGGGALKPRLAGGRDCRPFSTDPTARSARKLTELIISSIRDWWVVCQDFVYSTCLSPWRRGNVPLVDSQNALLEALYPTLALPSYGCSCAPVKMSWDD
jgi:hypothetical protein